MHETDWPSFATLHTLALRAARSHARRHDWLGIDDAMQEAMLEMVKALRALTFVPDDINNYLRRVAHVAVSMLVWSMRSPVTHHDRATLPKTSAEMQRATSATLSDIPHTERPDDLLDEAEWRFGVQIRFAELFVGDADIDQLIAWRVLLNDESCAEVADDEDVPVRAVYVVTQRMRQRILKDREMYDMLRQLAQTITVKTTEDET